MQDPRYKDFKDIQGYPVPKRFYPNDAYRWVRENAPKMRPHQFTALVAELRRRTWKDQEIREEVMPYRPRT